MKDNKKTEHQTRFFSEWLEQLQQESWQLELLISGFALYGIWEAKPMIESFSNYIDINQASGSFQVIANMSMNVLNAGWIIFFINLLVHIILRGLWIGAIGLRYVSNDIDYDALNYSEWMTSYLRRKVGKYDDYIERLERLCSVIFAYTFLLFFIFLSAALFFGEIGVVTSLFKDSFQANSNISVFVQMIFTVYIILGFLIFLDFITLGMFKKVKDPTFAKVYGWIYRIYSYVTFSFMYRALLYNFLDDKYTKRLFLFSIPYVLFIVLIFPTLYANAHPHFPYFDEAGGMKVDVMERMTIRQNNYDDLREASLKTGFLKKRQPIRLISLNEYEVEGRYLKVFLSMRQKDAEIFEAKGIEPFFAKGLRIGAMKNVLDDSLAVELEERRNEEKDPIIKQRRAMRDKFKAEGLSSKEARKKVNPIFEAKLNHVDSLYNKYEEDLYQSRYNRVQEVFTELAELFIDEEPLVIDLNMAKFTRHANLGEKGLLCYIPMDSLSHGPHIMKLKRIYDIRDKEDEPRISEIYIPFMKMD